MIVNLLVTKRPAARFLNRAIVTFLLTLCVIQVTNASAQGEHSPRVIEATLPALGGIVHWIAPDATLHCLLPDGADPHHFHPGVRQIEQIQQASLLIRSSRDDVAWFGDTPIGSVPVMDVWQAAHNTQHNTHDHEHHHGHAWLLADDVYAQLPRLLEALQPLLAQPVAGDRISALHAGITEINAAWQPVMNELRQRGVVMQHPSWQPLFEHYQVPVLAVLEANSIGHSHSFHAKGLEAALESLKQHPRAVLIADKRHDDSGLKWLQRHHPGSQLVYLDPVGSCEQTWPELMKQNITWLQTALSSNRVNGL